ncbi:hypothetical protein NSE_0555 [Neorickettsia sennetsu str. Miyayama]|uniref:Uncharacterized protein n=1 Tax=Ehrlichia sennetsu (strain ATCC VR-367 / Miyayama) TaxID=222891 RepID=Q2GDK9_EHRS3|nr:hypothetical protein NSE_0555 [Neorickettsia sennetsu str. Miyayama]
MQDIAAVGTKRSYSRVKIIHGVLRAITMSHKSRVEEL